MLKQSCSLLAILAVVTVACLVNSAYAASFTFGDFEDFLFVSQDFPGNYNVTSSSGQIHNGATPDNGPGPDSQPTPDAYPAKPGGMTHTYGNWDRGGAGGSNDDRNTGWGDWKYGSVGGAESSQAVFSSSTTTGVTSGSKSLRMNPQLFGGTAPPFTQHLAVKLQLMPDPFGDETYTAYIANKYLAVDITMDSSEWTGTGNFVQFGMDMNSSGAAESTQPLVDRFGYWGIGNYVENTANPSVAARRTPNLDTGNPGNPGLWDPTNFPGVTTRTLYWDYSNWQAPPGSPYTDGGTGLPGGPAPNLWYDARTFGTMSGTDGDAGYIEFNSNYSYSQAFTAGSIYFDNWRFVDELPISLADADFDDDNDVDADDIDILWHIVRATGTDPGGNDTADLNGDSFVNEDDVDFMLASQLDAGTNMRYGDANLSGGTPELTDYNRWRTGTGGWAGGDFDGSGGVPELNDYNLWRTGPTQFPGSVGSHGGGGGPGAPLVPEPATMVLMGLGLPVLVLVARQRKRQ